jgi:hypothetical protein
MKNILIWFYYTVSVITNQNATVAAEEYAARFPNRRRTNPHVILRLISRARHTGSLNLTLKGLAGAPGTARVHAMEEAIGTGATEGELCGSSKSTTHRIIKCDHQHYTRVQHLRKEDYP